MGKNNKLGPWNNWTITSKPGQVRPDDPNVYYKSNAETRTRVIDLDQAISKGNLKPSLAEELTQSAAQFKAMALQNMLMEQIAKEQVALEKNIELEEEQAKEREASRKTVTDAQEKINSDEDDEADKEKDDADANNEKGTKDTAMVPTVVKLNEKEMAFEKLPLEVQRQIDALARDELQQTYDFQTIEAGIEAAEERRKNDAKIKSIFVKEKKKVDKKPVKEPKTNFK